MKNNQQKKGTGSKTGRIAFFILLVWACAVAFATCYRRPVHATTDLCSLTKKVFHLQQTVGWKLDFAQASAILNSTALQTSEQTFPTASTDGRNLEK